MSQVSITGMSDIDFAILVKMDLDSLHAIKDVNTFYSKMYLDEKLWIERVKWFFPGAERMKNDDRSWIDYYHLLSSDLKTICSSSATDVFEYLFSQETFDLKAVLPHAGETLLNFLISKGAIQSDQLLEGKDSILPDLIRTNQDGIYVLFDAFRKDFENQNQHDLMETFYDQVVESTYSIWIESIKNDDAETFISLWELARKNEKFDLYHDELWEYFFDNAFRNAEEMGAGKIVETVYNWFLNRLDEMKDVNDSALGNFYTCCSSECDSSSSPLKIKFVERYEQMFDECERGGEEEKVEDENEN